MISELSRVYKYLNQCYNKVTAV